MLAYPHLCTQRYESATLHTIKAFSGLPFIPFPEQYPEYVPAKLIAQYYASYAQSLDLPTICGCECKSATWDEDKCFWKVILNHRGKEQRLSVRHIVFAVGIFGRFPIKPSFPGQENFGGATLHSAAYTNPSTWKGKKVAVVGASTTGIDVAYDCSRMGINVTMVQRGATRVYPEGHLAEIKKPFWNNNSSPDIGDTLTTKDPVVLQSAVTSAAFLLLSKTFESDIAYARVTKY